MLNPYYKLRSPDGDSSLNGNGDSSADSQKTDSGKVPDKTTASKDSDTEKLAKGMKLNGIKSVLKKLSDSKGYDIVYDDNGLIDVEGTLEQLPSKEKKAIKKAVQDTDEKEPDEKDERLQLAEKAAKKAREDHEQYVANAEVRSALKDLNVKPKALESARKEFLSIYSIKENSDGEIRVYDGKKLVANDKGSPATVVEALSIYLEEHDFYLNPDVKSGDRKVTSLSGKPDTPDISKLSERERQKVRQEELDNYRKKHS